MAEVTIQLKAPEPRALALDPKSALVVVDVENEFIAPGRDTATWASAVRTPGPASRLAGPRACRGRPVIYVHSVREATNPEFTVFNVDEHLMRGSWGAEYCEEIVPSPASRSWTSSATTASSARR